MAGGNNIIKVVGDGSTEIATRAKQTIAVAQKLKDSLIREKTEKDKKKTKEAEISESNENLNKQKEMAKKYSATFIRSIASLKGTYHIITKQGHCVVTKEKILAGPHKPLLDRFETSNYIDHQSVHNVHLGYIKLNIINDAGDKQCVIVSLENTTKLPYYNEIQPIIKYPNIFIVKENRLSFVINKKGERISEIYKGIDQDEDALIGRNYYMYEEEKASGYFYSDLNLIGDKIIPSHNWREKVNFKNGDIFYLGSANGLDKCVILDKKGNVLMQGEIYKRESNKSDYDIIKIDDKKYVIISEDEREIVDDVKEVIFGEHYDYRYYRSTTTLVFENGTFDIYGDVNTEKFSKGDKELILGGNYYFQRLGEDLAIISDTNDNIVNHGNFELFQERQVDGTLYKTNAIKKIIKSDYNSSTYKTKRLIKLYNSEMKEMKETFTEFELGQQFNYGRELLEKMGCAIAKKGDTEYLVNLELAVSVGPRGKSVSYWGGDYAKVSNIDKDGNGNDVLINKYGQIVFGPVETIYNCNTVAVIKDQGEKYSIFPDLSRVGE